MNMTRVHSSCEQSRKEGKKQSRKRERVAFLFSAKSCEPCYMHTETLSSTSPSSCPFFIVFLSFDVDAQRQIQQLKAEKDQGKKKKNIHQEHIILSSALLCSFTSIQGINSLMHQQKKNTKTFFVTTLKAKYYF